MANLNNTAPTILNSPGLFGGGQTSAGTGNDAGGFESAMPDMFQVPFTATSASPAVYTVPSAYSVFCVNGTPVTLGYTSALYPYTATSASPAVFTCKQAVGTSAAGEDYSMLGAANPLAQGVGVVLYGTPPTGFSASTTINQQGFYFPGASITQYYVVAGGLSTTNGTFQLSATQGGSAINSTSAVSSLANTSMLQFVTGVPGGFGAQVTYYMVSVSSNTFQLAATVGGAAINSTSIGAGFLQFDLLNQQVSATVGSQQVNWGAGTSYQGIVLGGWRVGIQPGQVVASASSMSLDESPQMAWQNVAGSTCQTGNANTDTGATTAANTFPGWGQAGGYSTSGAAGQYVDEVKAPVVHLDDNGTPETAEHRKVRLTKELDALKAKSNKSAAEAKRQDVVEKALNELK